MRVWEVVRLRAFAPVLVLVGLWLVAGVSYGCSCVPMVPVNEAFASSHAVFAGTAVSARAEGSWLVVEFQVNESWKDRKDPRVSVRTASHNAACGYPFVVGETYLVYAAERPSEAGILLATSICTRTGRMSNRAADLEALGKPLHVMAGREARPGGGAEVSAKR